MILMLRSWLLRRLRYTCSHSEHRS